MKAIKKIAIFLSVIVLLSACSNGQDGNNNTIKDQVIGIVSNATMNSLSIKTTDDKEFTFSLIALNDAGNNIELFEGDNITILFNGIIYTDKNSQDEATVTSIKINEYADLLNDKNWNLDGVFKDYYTLASRKLLLMTEDERIGQILFARVPTSNQIESITKYHLGGYIMFGRDFKGKTKDEVIANTNSFQTNSEIPMIIAADEEGGDVVRISSNPNLASEKFKSPQEVFAKGGFDLISSDTVNKSNLMKSLGLNMNLAPVSDVSTSSNDYIYDRSFGHDAKQTSEFVKTVINASQGHDVTYVLKHFPGYGNNKDTHTGIAIDERSIESFRENDFLPFKAGIDNNALAILVAHNVVKCIDDKTPASLSKPWHDLLRNELGFTGIIMTDDLAMEAIKDYASVTPEVDALNAGNDLLIITDYVTAFNNVKTALANGTLSEDTLNYATLRVLAYKYYTNLLPNN